MLINARRALVLAFAVSSVCATPTFAHHPGGGGNAGDAGPIFTIPASTLDEGQLAVGVMFEYVRLRTLSNATLINAAVTGNEGVHDLKTIESASALVAYGLTHDLTVGMRVPWVGRTGIREGDETNPLNPIVLDRGSTFGFSDVTFLGQYRFFNDKKTQTEATVLLGVKAPTGVTNRYDNQGELFDAEFQPGSGAWSALFGLAVTKRFGSWSLDSNVLYILSSTGTQDTNLGDRFLYNAAISYRLTGSASEKNGHSHSMKLGADFPEPMYHGGPKASATHSHEEPAASPAPALDLVLELNGELHQKQVTSGVVDQNSGGNLVYLSPGLRLSYDKWSSYVSVGIPVVNEPYGIQPEPSWRLISGVSLTF
jgi:outer membrane putative beta-barrel porin/alpha-amylase